MIKVGNKVKVVRLIHSDYAIHPSFAIGKEYQVVSITDDKCIRPLKYGLDIGCDDTVYFGEDEVELIK